jgi:HSP20 family protein
MKKHVLRNTLIVAGLLGAIGVAGAAAHEALEQKDNAAAPDIQVQPQQQTPQDAWMPQDPWASMHADMMRMQSQIDQMFNSTFKDLRVNPYGYPDQQAGARVTLQDKGGNYVVKAKVPGASEDDINVNLNGRLLSISSRTGSREQDKSDNGRMIQQQSFASSFQEAFTLPGPVNAAGMQSQFKDGVLTLTIPKVTS